MSDLKFLGLAIEKLFTQLINVSASLMKGCIKFSKAAWEGKPSTQKISENEFEENQKGGNTRSPPDM